MTDDTAAQGKPWYRRWWVWALAALGAIVIIAALSEPDDGDENASASTTTAAETTTTTEGTSTTAAETTTTTEGTTTTAAETTTTTEGTTTTTIPVAFADGTWLVGTDIEPGLYETVDFSGSSCYWERVSDLSGDFSAIIANDNPDGKAIVAISDGDEAFSSQRCGDWIVPVVLEEPLTEFPDGTWIVGDQIAPGRYRNDGTNSCYWERLSGFSGEFGDIRANDNADGSTIVDIASNDVGFSSSSCGTWSRVES